MGFHRHDIGMTDVKRQWSGFRAVTCPEYRGRQSSGNRNFTSQKTACKNRILNHPLHDITHHTIEGDAGSMATTPYMIKSFGVVSVGKFCAVIGLVWGFFMGCMVALGIGGAAGMLGGSHALGIGAGIVGLVVMIIAGGVFGFIWGAIAAVIYNIILGAIGGIEMDLEAKP
jgi:hypothetical protein